MNDDAQSQESSPVTMFLMLAVLVAAFLAFWYLRPHAKPADEFEGGPSAASSAAGDKDAEMRRWADQARKDYVDAFGKGMPEGMTPDQIQGNLRGELQKMQGNPAFSDEQRSKVKSMLEKSLGK